MSTDIEHLAAGIGDSLGSGSANMPPWLWRLLLHLLARGRPVTVNDLAAVTGQSVSEVREALAGLPDTEYDEQGRVVGHGITLRPTPHRFEVDGRALFTWCALDTLIFPAVLGRTAHITSPCHATGIPVRLTVAPGAVTGVDPPTALVSIVTPGACTSIRTAFCNEVHFFASPAAARPWLHRHPGATVLPVTQAFALGGQLIRTLFADGKDSCC